MRVFFLTLFFALICTPASNALPHPTTHFKHLTTDEIPGASFQEKTLNLILSANLDKYWERRKFPYLTEIVSEVSLPHQVDQISELVFIEGEYEWLHKVVIKNKNPNIDLLQVLKNYEYFATDDRFKSIASAIEKRRDILNEDPEKLGERLQRELRPPSTTNSTTHPINFVTDEILQLAGAVKTPAAYYAFLETVQAVKNSGAKYWSWLENPWIFKIVVSFKSRRQLSLLKSALTSHVSKKGIFRLLKKTTNLSFEAINTLKDILRKNQSKKRDASGDVISEFNSLTINEFSKLITTLEQSEPLLPPRVATHYNYAKNLIKANRLTSSDSNNIPKILVHMALNASTDQARNSFQLFAQLGFNNPDVFYTITEQSLPLQQEMLNDLWLISALTPATAEVVAKAMEHNEQSLATAIQLFYKSNPIAAQQISTKLSLLNETRQLPGQYGNTIQIQLEALKTSLTSVSQPSKWLSKDIYKLTEKISTETSYLAFLRVAELVQHSLEYNRNESFINIANFDFFTNVLEISHPQQIRLIEVFRQSHVTLKPLYNMIFKLTNESNYTYQSVYSHLIENISRGDDLEDIKKIPKNTTTVASLKVVLKKARAESKVLCSSALQ